MRSLLAVRGWCSPGLGGIALGLSSGLEAKGCSRLTWVMAVLCLALAAPRAGAAEPAAAAEPGVAAEAAVHAGQAEEAGSGYALILAGLAGDAEHQPRFRAILRAWQRWLVHDLNQEKFADGNVTILDGTGGPTEAGHLPAGRQDMRRAVEELRSRIRPDDRLWVLVLGHASYDGRRAWLHLPGPDLDDLELAELFAGVECREQVFWLTHTCSGWFLRSLAQKGRVVITATEADREFNETEFPEAMVAVLQRSPETWDTDGDGQVTLAELLIAVNEEVGRRFVADNRAPTEHAQLDDDGDGRGTEVAELAAPAPATEAEAPLSLRRDGAVARRLILYRLPEESITAPGEPLDEPR